MGDEQVTTLTARYVFPVAGLPLAGGCVTISGERVVAVQRSAPSSAIDLGDVALIPGLVNAHTHLEFSQFAAPLGKPGMPLPDWILQVIAARRSGSVDAAAAIRAGLAEARSTGTTTLGEIATGGWTENLFAEAGVELTAFYELLGLPAERVAERLAAAGQFATESAGARRWKPGLSPHAPYSTHPELVVGLLRLAAQHHFPVAMHIAESREELQLLSDGTGPFRELLEALDVWDGAAIPHGTRPLEYLELLAEAPRALVIHGNYLAADELEYLAVHPDRMSVVYCPRTHAYFQHTRYPLERMLDLGINVALGTDSRASNPDLSMLGEMRFVARNFPGLPAKDILRLGTIAGAQALGQQREAGTIEPGKLANLAIVPVAADHRPADPHELLFDSDAAVAATYFRGRRSGDLTVGSS